MLDVAPRKMRAVHAPGAAARVTGQKESAFAGADKHEDRAFLDAGHEEPPERG